MDLFRTVALIYTAPNISFVNEIDDNVSPVVLNLMLSRYYKVSHVVKYLNKYAFTLDAKQYAALAWSMIQPKFSNAPFVKKIAKEDEEETHYDFLLDRIKKRFDIGNNDWVYCKPYFLEDVKEKTEEYLVFYGCTKKEWSKLGRDFEDSKKVNVTEVKSGLDKWF